MVYHIRYTQIDKHYYLFGINCFNSPDLPPPPPQDCKVIIWSKDESTGGSWDHKVNNTHIHGLVLLLLVVFYCLWVCCYWWYFIVCGFVVFGGQCTPDNWTTSVPNRSGPFIQMANISDFYANCLQCTILHMIHIYIHVCN